MSEQQDPSVSLPASTERVRQLIDEMRSYAGSGSLSVQVRIEKWAERLEAVLGEAVAPAPQLRDHHDEHWRDPIAARLSRVVCHPELIAPPSWHDEARGLVMEIEQAAKQRVAGCIACGETNDGGYMVEDGPGPFCSMCWQALEDDFRAAFQADALRSASSLREGQ